MKLSRHLNEIQRHPKEILNETLNKSQMKAYSEFLLTRHISMKEPHLQYLFQFSWEFETAVFQGIFNQVWNGGLSQILNIWLFAMTPNVLRFMVWCIFFSQGKPMVDAPPPFLNAPNLPCLGDLCPSHNGVLTIAHRWWYMMADDGRR